VPVIPSMCETETGERLNVNADTAATAVAQALGAEKLVFLSDVNGVRRDKNDPDSLIHSLTAKDAGRLIGEGAIEAGMIPKVEACLETLQKGVRKIHIIDGRNRHSLMLEIINTNQGIGTEDRPLSSTHLRIDAHNNMAIATSSMNPETRSFSQSTWCRIILGFRWPRCDGEGSAGVGRPGTISVQMPWFVLNFEHERMTNSAIDNMNLPHALLQCFRGTLRLSVSYQPRWRPLRSSARHLWP